ncbi:hypothetical protein [Thioclava sp. GXIMD2076]|uniref:hypothetical protein n=1 Tax=unclassified Thioclava TaxID=2621713 RepID=UPI0030D5AB78
MRAFAIILLVISALMGLISLVFAPLLVSLTCANTTCTHETALALSVLFMIAPLVLCVLGIGLSVVLFKRSAPKDAPPEEG